MAIVDSLSARFVYERIVASALLQDQAVVIFSCFEGGGAGALFTQLLCYIDDLEHRVVEHVFVRLEYAKPSFHLAITSAIAVPMDDLLVIPPVSRTRCTQSSTGG